jgi:hypothetical protein
MAEWFTQKEQGGFPIERTSIGYFHLSVLYAGGEWQWLIQREGRDVAEGGHSVHSRRGNKPKQRRGGSYSADFRGYFCT